MNLNTARVFVRDVAQARHFYAEALGLAAGPEEGGVEERGARRALEDFLVHRSFGDGQVFVEEHDRPDQPLAWHKVFSGWLFKNSPSANVVEHPVYDVWVKDCAMKFPGEEGAPAAAASNAANPSGNASAAPAPTPGASAAPTAKPSPTPAKPAPKPSPKAAPSPSIGL